MAFNPHILEHDFSKYDSQDIAMQIMDTAQKLWNYLSQYEKILVSVSGGSDSDIIVDLINTFAPELMYKCHFVFVNTGLEYSATKNHLKQLSNKYGVEIRTIRGMSIVSCVKKYGVPILNKEKSAIINAYCRDITYAINKMNQNNQFGFTQEQKEMVKFIKEHNIRISSECCNRSKKKPLSNYIKNENIELNITGERKAEGGIRAYQHKSCFERKCKLGIPKFMPLWWWTNEMKANYKKVNNVIYSDCYEVWGMKRTGCVGCPFNINLGNDLKMLKQFEPQMFKACLNVFGTSYILTDLFNCRKRRILTNDLLNYKEVEEMMEKLK